MGVKCRVHYLVFTTDDEVQFLLFHCSQQLSIIGCTTSTPDGSSPRGYIVELYLFNYRLKFSLVNHNLCPA
jgi:hypothetical protein